MAATEDENQGVVRITLRDVYNEVSALREDVRPLVGAVPDHEKRIRTLERWAYGLPPTFILALAAMLKATS